MKRKYWLILAIGFSVIVCVSHFLQKTSLPLDEDSNTIRSAVLKKIPIGTPIEDGVKIMEAEGFECWKRAFDPDALDVLCRIRHRTWTQFFRNCLIDQYVDVFLIYKSGVIIDVRVDWSAIGL